MLKLCGRATASSYAEFSQSLETCTLKLENLHIFNICTSLLHILTPWVEENLMEIKKLQLFYRPGVAGAVLQTALLLINKFIMSAFSSSGGL